MTDGTMLGRGFWIAVFATIGAGASSAQTYTYKALACTMADGTVMRIETDVARDSAGRPVTEDRGVARVANGLAWVSGRFDLRGNDYVFVFGQVTVTIDREGGAALLQVPNRASGVLMQCAPTVPHQG